MTLTTRFICLFALALLAVSAPVPAQRGNDQLANTGGSTPIIAFSILEKGLPAGADDGGNNRTTNPLFVDASGPDIQASQATTSQFEGTFSGTLMRPEQGAASPSPMAVSIYRRRIMRMIRANNHCPFLHTATNEETRS